MRLAVLLLAAFIPASAFAGVLTINSPDVKKGEFSLEAGMSLERDDKRDYDHFREHVLEMGYSPTYYWNTALEFTAEREAGEGLHYAVTGWENTFQFIKQNDAFPLSVGMRLQYEKSHLSGESDEIAARLLLRHKGERFETRLNIGGEKEIGGDAEDGVAGDLRASVRYRYNDNLNPAIDYLGDTGSLHRLQGFAEQDHRLGPVLYGKLSDTLEYEIGYLAGISTKAPDHTFKVGLEYSFMW